MFGKQFGLVLFLKLLATWSGEPQTCAITEHMQWSTRMTYGPVALHQILNVYLQRTAVSFLKICWHNFRISGELALIILLEW